VQFAVTETARGGVLLRGVGVAYNDVSVVTNVSADHLGLQGIDTLDQLAEVKAVITKITKPSGYVVVNGDDPRTFAMRLGSPATAVVFSTDADSPSLRAALNEGGWAVTVLDGDVVVIRPGGDPDHLVPVVDVPMTLAGLSRYNVENALAAAAAGLAAGLPRTAVVEGLRTFRPDPAHNPGRLNIYSIDDRTVILDVAHNEASLDALLEVAHGLRPAGAAVHLALGTAGDRTDDVLVALGEIAARGSDHLVVVDKPTYLRGRTAEEMRVLYRAGAAAVGVPEVPAFDTELDALQSLLAASRRGDVIAVMIHEQRAEADALLRERGATVDSPDEIRAKVLRAGH
jgi:cyanophycin synthetase